MKLNNRGASLLSIIAISGAISIGIWFLSDRVSNQQKISAGLTEDISYNLAIKSVTDYAVYFVKNQWCFTSQNPQSLMNSEVSECADNYLHPYSAARLMLPIEYSKVLFEQKSQLNPALQANFPTTYQAMRYTNSIAPYNLPGFTITSEISGISSENKIKKILNNIRGKVAPKYVRLYFMNEVDSTLPGTTNETYIRIVTQLLDENQNLIRNGANYVSETVRLYVAPRENNYFSLILGGSIYVGKSSVAASDDVGSLYLPSATGTGYGINFYSPIFIQQDLKFVSTAQKTPVTFHDSVVFGVGGVKGIPRNVTLGDKKFWDDLDLFGGFKNNFEIDAKKDLGLVNIADPANTTAASANNQNLDMCIKLLRSTNDSVATKGSLLYLYNTDVAGVPAISGNNFSRNYRFSFKKDEVSGVRKFFKTLNKPSAEYERLGKTENATSKIEYQIMGPATSPATGLAPSVAASPISLYAAIKWNNQILDLIPVLLPVESSAGVFTPLTTQFRLYTDKTSTTFTPVNITLKRSPIISGEEQSKAFKDVTIEVEGLNNLSNIPIQYVKLMAFDETCGYSAAKPGPPAVPATQLGQECLTNPGSGEAKIVYIRKLTNFGSEPANCQFDVPYTNESMSSATQCVNTSAIVIPSAAERETELTVNYAQHINQCFQSSNLSTLGSSNELENQFVNNTYNGWEAFPSVPASSTPGFTNYADITFTSFNSSNPVSGAIYKKCTVPASVSVVIGNFLCKELEILQRSTALDMIGTFIVTNKMTVHPSVYTHGLDFYNFHHIDAVNFLRQNGVFKTIDGSNCNTMPTPHWHPDPGLINQANRLNCSSASVFKGTDVKYPFRWTSVTADCAHLSSVDTNTKCIKRLRNFIYRPLERVYGKQN